MLRDRDFIVFSDDWGRHPFSCQHLVKQLLHRNRILWINTVGYRALKLNGYDLKRSVEKLYNWLHPKMNINMLRKISPNLRILNPVCLPFGGVAAARFFNSIVIRWVVNHEIAHWGITRPLLLTTLPSSADFIDGLDIEYSIYYCVDDFTLWPGGDRDLMFKLEQKLLSKVDLVIATSEKLARSRSNGKRQTKVLTHGVDLEHFSPVSRMTDSQEKKNIKDLIVGYFGLIDERCDMTLLIGLARAMREVTFLIIGSWRVDPTPLANLPNVRITGQVSYENLPDFLSHVSALILPYRVNELAESINPLKLKEYLATGLPVIATPLPEVVKLNQFVKVASNVEEFRVALDEAFNIRRGYSRELKNFLLSQTWQAKAEQFSAMVNELVKKQG